MFGFHKPKMYRSLEGCCICRAKSSSSRFTDSKRYERDFKTCFGLGEVRCGEICNACVLLVKRWKKLPVGSKKNWNHVVDAKGGSSLKATVKTKKIKKAKPSQISRVQKELKRNNSDAHSTTSSTSPAQSPSYSNQSDEGSDMELSPGAAHAPVFSFLDLTYWKRKKVCCGIIYKGRYGEVLIDPHLYKPCCQKKRQPQQEEEEEPQQEDVEEEEEEEDDEEEEGEEVEEVEEEVEEPANEEKEMSPRQQSKPPGSPGVKAAAEGEEEEEEEEREEMEKVEQGREEW